MTVQAVPEALIWITAILVFFSMMAAVAELLDRHDVVEPEVAEDVPGPYDQVDDPVEWARAHERFLRAKRWVVHLIDNPADRSAS
jgi:hypothetical protein